MAKSPTAALEQMIVSDPEITIEPVSSTVDMNDSAAVEAFMHEVVTIFVHDSPNENDMPYVLLNVNGTNQVFPRGVEVEIKRKYLEVLARMKETKYTQRTPNPSEPDRIQMVERHAHVYPFDLVKDTARGRAWLSHILKQPA